MKYENESDPSVNWGHLNHVDFTADTDHVSAKAAERYAAAALRNRVAFNAAPSAETASSAETIVVRGKASGSWPQRRSLGECDQLVAFSQRLKVRFARVTSAQGRSDETDAQ